MLSPQVLLQELSSEQFLVALGPHTAPTVHISMKVNFLTDNQRLSYLLKRIDLLCFIESDMERRAFGVSRFLLCYQENGRNLKRKTKTKNFFFPSWYQPIGVPTTQDLICYIFLHSGNHYTNKENEMRKNARIKKF